MKTVAKKFSKIFFWRMAIVIFFLC